MKTRSAVSSGLTAKIRITALTFTCLSGPLVLESRAQPVFTNVPVANLDLLGVGWSSVAWGDYDNDGHLDFLVMGYHDYFNELSLLWRNTGSGFTIASITGLPQIAYGSVAWGDYDNDGRLDFLIMGDNGFRYSQLWRNTGSGFTNVPIAGLPEVSDGCVAWGDYDNDGRLDFFLAGMTFDGPVSQLWHNNDSTFTNVPIPGLPGVYNNSVAWGDYDNDGRLDFFFSGGDTSPLWRNTGNGFTNVPIPGLPPLAAGSAAWADYDNDGHLDFFLMDGDASPLWRNTGSGFTNVPIAGLPQVAFGSVAWGDYDNDGRLDFLITGTSNYVSGVSQVWRNTGSGFTNVPIAGLPQLAYSSVAWGDYDNDGRLDFLLTGSPDGSSGISQLWRNITPVTNAPPGAPTGLALTATTNAVMLSWNSAPDDHTPAPGLTYNVRAGTTPGGIDLFAGHVNTTNGFRRVPAMGNAYLRHSLPLTGLTNGQTVYWSVQAVDTAFAGGPFATETSVVTIPTLFVTTNSQPSTINISWTPPTWGWYLEETPALNPAAWTNSPSGVLNPVSVSTTNSATFYRLKNQ